MIRMVDADHCYKCNKEPKQDEDGIYLDGEGDVCPKCGEFFCPDCLDNHECIPVIP